MVHFAFRFPTIFALNAKLTIIVENMPLRLRGRQFKDVSLGRCLMEMTNCSVSPWGAMA